MPNRELQNYKNIQQEWPPCFKTATFYRIPPAHLTGLALSTEIQVTCYIGSEHVLSNGPGPCLLELVAHAWQSTIN